MNGVHVRLRIGAERYALPVENVREIAELGQLTPVPGAPAIVLGIRNLHGQILPVYDLAAVLGMAGGEPAARLLVVERAGRLVGLAIDEVRTRYYLRFGVHDKPGVLGQLMTILGAGLFCAALAWFAATLDQAFC